MIKHNCPHFGIHFRVIESDFAEENSIEWIKSRAEKDVKYFIENIKIPLLIENIPNYAAIKEFTEPYYISEVCEKYDIGLLLDLSHAKITAINSGKIFINYIKELPLNKVREIHINGTFCDDKLGIRDKHLEMQDVDYKNLMDCLEICEPNYVTLEYGGFGESMKYRSDKDVIKRQLDNLIKMLK